MVSVGKRGGWSVLAKEGASPLIFQISPQICDCPLKVWKSSPNFVTEKTDSSRGKPILALYGYGLRSSNIFEQNIISSSDKTPHWNKYS